MSVRLAQPAGVLALFILMTIVNICQVVAAKITSISGKKKTTKYANCSLSYIADLNLDKGALTMMVIPGLYLGLSL